MRELLPQFLAVGLGGFVGAIARFGMTLGIKRYVDGFPAATLLINLLGCFLLGLLLGIVHEAESFSAEARAFLAVGLLGSFTTFATFSSEAVQLLRDKEHGAAAAYLLGSVILGLLLFVAGHALGLRR